MDLKEAMKRRMVFEKVRRKMSDAGMDTSHCRYITDLKPVLENHLPPALAAEAKELLENKEALTALLEAVTGCADAGSLIDAIYEPSIWGETVQCDTFSDLVEAVYNHCKYDVPGNDAPFTKKEGSNA